MANNSSNRATKEQVVYTLPGMDTVSIQRGVPYHEKDGVTLTMDIYYPPNASQGTLLPVVLFVVGFTNDIIIEQYGVKLKDKGQYVSWGKLTAVSGFIAITYETTEPAADSQQLLNYLKHKGHTLGIDTNQIALWACSGNVPTALWLLMEMVGHYLRCAVFYYGAMLDSDETQHVTKAAQAFGFANPCQGKRVNSLPRTVPMFIVQAGQDAPQLNESITNFVREALLQNLPITVVKHTDGHHGFDIVDNSLTSRTIIQQTLAFWHQHLKIS